MKRLSLALATIMVVAMVSGASAQILWDQSEFDAFGPGFYNSESGGPPFGITQHAVNHVTVPGNWHVTRIATHYSATDPGFGLAIATGYLHVWPKTGQYPTEDPTASQVVLMQGVLMSGPTGDYFEVSTVGLDLNLAPGEYWIGITPVAYAGPFGPEIHFAATSKYGDDSMSYDPFAMPGPPAWFTFNPGIDATLVIEGSGPVPNESRSVGAIKVQFDN